MNKIIIFFTLASFTGFSQSKFVVTPKEGQIKWKGSDLLGGGHEGTLQLRTGSFLISDQSRITQAEFVVDMNSIKAVDGDKGITELDDHLKSDDFFSVAKYPKAFFTVIQVSPAQTFLKPNQFTVTGFLTIRGITRQIIFPAVITINEGVAKVKADIVINRTQWDIIYHSQSFFNNLKDGVIADEIGISVDLEATQIN